MLFGVYGTGSAGIPGPVKVGKPMVCAAAAGGPAASAAVPRVVARVVVSSNAVHLRRLRAKIGMYVTSGNLAMCGRATDDLSTSENLFGNVSIALRHCQELGCISPTGGTR
jgi:hypothetical protein